jgi:GntR family transcriptional regulator, rspAB operon transcriptional repressor
MEFTKIQRERAIDSVYQALRQAIVTCAIKPGERLNVEDLSQKFGVSLTPVRGAIQQLATEGLIEIRPRSGTFVANLNCQELDETFKIRCALECLAGEEAIQKITPEQMRRLKELLRSLKKRPVTDEDRKAHEKDNSELHQTIVEAAGIRKLLEMYNALNAHIKIVRIHAAESNWPVRMQEEQNEHEAIVAALETRDAQALTAALRKHIYRAKNSMLAALKASQEQAEPAVSSR